ARGPVNGTIPPPPTQHRGNCWVDHQLKVHPPDIAIKKIEFRYHKKTIPVCFKKKTTNQTPIQKSDFLFII
ncbi:hypothetical protein ACVGV7_12625, partial [Enterobacter intestinihominis]